MNRVQAREIQQMFYRGKGYFGSPRLGPLYWSSDDLNTWDISREMMDIWEEHWEQNHDMGNLLRLVWAWRDED